tara:strand:- start:74 stop:313 length:240 start_codon:yes stop_codon:yes gene_type:complete
MSEERKLIAISKPIEETPTSVYRCVVHITKQCEVLFYAKDKGDAIEQVEALTEQELTDYGDCFKQHKPKVVKCEVTNHE